MENEAENSAADPLATLSYSQHLFTGITASTRAGNLELTSTLENSNKGLQGSVEQEVRQSNDGLQGSVERKINKLQECNDQMREEIRRENENLIITVSARKSETESEFSDKLPNFLTRLDNFRVTLRWY